MLKFLTNQEPQKTETYIDENGETKQKWEKELEDKLSNRERKRQIINKYKQQRKEHKQKE